MRSTSLAGQCAVANAVASWVCSAVDLAQLELPAPPSDARVHMLLPRASHPCVACSCCPYPFQHAGWQSCAISHTDPSPRHQGCACILMCRMGIKALPYLARIPPGLAITDGGAVSVPAEEVLPTAGYPWGPQRIAEFVAERTGLAVGEAKHAPAISPR